MVRRSALGWAVVVALAAAPWALAQDPPESPPAEPADEAEERAAAEQEGKLEEEITVTGTRFEGRTVTDTPAPVSYLDAAAIQSVGSTETGRILQMLEPSANFSTTFISDGTDAIRPATLRALGPDQTLLLVNGKRRHQQSLVHYQQTVGRGSAGYDLNAIPVSAIDHIEVLRDGAAAQYGSDAIAGVVNVILKEGTGRTDVSIDTGQYYEGDGTIFGGSVNSGFAVGDQGFVNLTVEYRDREETNRAGLDVARVDPPRVTQRIGDPDAKDAMLWLNSAFSVGDGQLYLFGGWSERETNSSGFFRSAGDGRTVPDLYPNGFLPTIVTEPTDRSLVAGYRGDFDGGWKYDFSLNWGESEFAFREENTVNVSYWYEPIDPNDPDGPKFFASPTAADTGTLSYDHLTANADFSGVVDWGVGAGPLNVALGLEWRDEGFQIEPGDEVSFEYGRTNNGDIVIRDQNGGAAAAGTQGFPGFQDAVDESRDSVAIYGDFESQLSEKFLAGAAVRYEDFSDFGGTAIGKLSARYDFSDRFALRSTVSTGFRAPGVQQAFFTLRSTNLNSAGVLTDTLTAANNSAVARALGIPGLKEEESTGISVGTVVRPSDRFRLTVDLYRIDIDDRIIFSDAISADIPAVGAVLAPFGVGQVQFFTNAIDTKTEGIDISALYDVPIGSSLLAIEAAVALNDTEVVARRSSSPIVPVDVLFPGTQVTLVEEGQPSEHYVLGGTWFYGDFSANLRFNYFGSVAAEWFTQPVKFTWGGEWLTDLSFSYRMTDDLRVTAGGMNIFDQYPDEWAVGPTNPFPLLGFKYGWETVPFGINGGYYFLRLGYSFDH